MKGTVIGVDPGLAGALAVLDLASGEVVNIEDMPTMQILTRSKKQVNRIDKVALFGFFEMQKMLGCRMVLMELMGGRKGQGADAGMQLGLGVGLMQGMCIALGIPLDEIPPGVWKSAYGVPGKMIDGKISKAALTAIVKRADELLPSARDLFRGPKGGLQVDRAEAAMIAKYCAERVLNIKPEG